MNKKQRIAILAGLALIALMLLVPPWAKKSPNPVARPFPPIDESIGYMLILTPPDPQAFIDAERLVIQCLCVAVVTAGVVFALHKRN